MPHIHTQPGQFDFTVEVFIVYKNKVLLRKHDKYGIWLGVGGHVELNEDPNQAALREVKEEVGLSVKLFSKYALATSAAGEYELIPPTYLTKHPIDKQHGHISNIYFARSSSDKVIPEKPTDEWRWLTRKDLELNQSLKLKPNIKYYALEALSALAK